MQRQEIGESIRRLRNLTGLTQREFSQKYHIPMNTLGKWEAGLRHPPAYVEELLSFRIRAELEQV